MVFGILSWKTVRSLSKRNSYSYGLYNHWTEFSYYFCLRCQTFHYQQISLHFDEILFHNVIIKSLLFWLQPDRFPLKPLCGFASGNWIIADLIFPSFLSNFPSVRGSEYITWSVMTTFEFRMVYVFNVLSLKILLFQWKFIHIISRSAKWPNFGTLCVIKRLNDTLPTQDLAQIMFNFSGLD